MFVREMEQELQAATEAKAVHAVPELEPGIRKQNDKMPKISRMQIELLVSSFVNDFNASPPCKTPTPWAGPGCVGSESRTASLACSTNPNSAPPAQIS